MTYVNETLFSQICDSSSDSDAAVGEDGGQDGSKQIIHPSQEPTILITGVKITSVRTF